MLNKFRKKLLSLNLVELSKSAINYNLKFFKNLHPESTICPVLKANAYGHGLTHIGKIIDQIKDPSLRPPYIVVDSYYEYLLLKKAKVKIPCLILGYNLHENFKKIRTARRELS